jgi:hypothetical protein
MHRDQSLISIRPEIRVTAESKQPDEKFQNETLRPILKLQHDCIMSVFSDFIQTHKIEFSHLSKEQREEIIHNSIKKNMALQSLLKGLIIGHFTESELSYWLLHKEQINKRIIQLCIKRVQSSYCLN